MDPSSSNGFQDLENRPNAPVSTSYNSDAILSYIDQFLMEDIELEPRLMLDHQDSSAFRAKERSFYEALGQKYPSSPQQHVDDANNTDVGVTTTDKNVPIQEFDDSVWMYRVDEKLAADMANMKITGNYMMQPAGGANVHSKKRNSTEYDEVVDLRALLTDCSKSLSLGDRVKTTGLLRRIRQHSSPFGDGNQSLAHYFANGLEARLSGTAIIHGITHTKDYLRAFRVSHASSPLRKITRFASNETIVIKSEKATRIHIVDFGILYGIQWPSFIRRVAGREGGPPEKLRITGVEFPQVAGIIEDTGRRLARYAETLGVPFEYKAIAREWETIKMDDLEIDKDEFVAVVCSGRSMKLMDESVCVARSPRAMFLELVREINPGIFVHTIINGAFNQPFFVYRFRDLLLYYLAVFDMLETLVPREKPERMMIERDLVGMEILNVIACEGPDRVERPETCRHWQVRHLKAGFMKVRFERKLMEAIMCKVKNSFHRDFSIFEEKQWMMMSWKGRVIYAISCWQPAAA